MAHRRIVVAEPFLRLLEVAADDVAEFVDRDLGVRIKGIEIVGRHESRVFIPPMLLGELVGRVDMRRRHVIDPEAV